jgi:predicted enzyme related to lactoylglutathione lyase
MGGGTQPDRLRFGAAPYAAGVELRFLYVASADTGRDLARWLAIPGATLRWRFRHFGADVAAVDLGAPPIVMLADHRPPGTILPIYAVDDLDRTVDALAADGWTIEARSLGTPEGPVAVVRDGSGNELALLRVDRPGVMDEAYADRSNDHAVR